MPIRKFSLAHLTILEARPPELIRIAARSGYDFVGLRLIPLGLPGEVAYAAQDTVLRREIKAAIDETGVQVLDVELARIIDGSSPDSYLPALEMAAELGARHVLSSVWMRDRHQVIERFARLCDVAKPLGLTVNLEFVSSTEWNTLEGALDVVDQLWPRQRRNHDRYATLPSRPDPDSTSSIAFRRRGRISSMSATTGRTCRRRSRRRGAQCARSGSTQARAQSISAAFSAVCRRA